MFGDPSAHCDGTVIVHDDRSFTCSNNVCTVTAGLSPWCALIPVSSHAVACLSKMAARDAVGTSSCTRRTEATQRLRRTATGHPRRLSTQGFGVRRVVTSGLLVAHEVSGWIPSDLTGNTHRDRRQAEVSQGGAGASSASRDFDRLAPIAGDALGPAAQLTFGAALYYSANADTGRVTICPDHTSPTLRMGHFDT